MNDLLLLATLLGGPLHGYALKKQIGAITGRGEMHNNLVYPLLKRFVAADWVIRKTVAGQRGQTRERYALTARGKRELLRRLSEFTEKDAAAGDAFWLRVGLFSVLGRDVRERILASRDAWLAARQEKLTRLAQAMNLGEWGGEVITYLRGQVNAEQTWMKRLRRKAQKAKASARLSQKQEG
jgi:DNA-binding PadR family transcriptional regulator